MSTSSSKRGDPARSRSRPTQALESDLRRRRLQQVIEAYEAGSGTIGDEELAEIRAQWQA